MLKAVIVDVDGTLYRQGPVRRYVFTRLILFGIQQPVTAWKTIRVLRTYRKAQEELRRGGEPGSARLQVEYVVRKTGYSKDFVDRSIEHWMHVVPGPAVAQARYKGVAEFLQWAGGQQIRLAVLSDYEARGKLRALGLAGVFSEVLSAQDDDVGVFKPAPLGLQTALRRLGVKADEALYVGDRVDVDGAAAAAAGIRGIVLCDGTANCPPGVATVGSWPELLERIQSEVIRPEAAAHAAMFSKTKDHS